MATTFYCSIVTPDRTVFEGDVSYASFPAWDGQQGVMVGQSPILTGLGYGTLRLDLEGGAHAWYLLEGGFAQVTEGALTLLTRAATPADELTVEAAEAELVAASAKVTEPGVDRKQAEADQLRALAKKALARSHGQR